MRKRQDEEKVGKRKGKKNCSSQSANALKSPLELVHGNVRTVFAVKADFYYWSLPAAAFQTPLRSGRLLRA